MAINFITELYFNTIVSLFVLLGHIALVVLALGFIYVRYMKKQLPDFLWEKWKFIEDNSLLFAFILALLGVIGSLIYSEVFRYAPCNLCWIQRILIYPQVIILGVALYKKERHIFDYVIGLNLLGVLFATYQYTLQMMNFTGSCPIGLGEVSCFTKEVLQFGYITLPLMSLTLFVFLTILTLAWKNADKEIVKRKSI